MRSSFSFFASRRARLLLVCIYLHFGSSRPLLLVLVPSPLKFFPTGFLDAPFDENPPLSLLLPFFVRDSKMLFFTLRGTIHGCYDLFFDCFHPERRDFSSLCSSLPYSEPGFPPTKIPARPRSHHQYRVYSLFRALFPFVPLSPPFLFVDISFDPSQSPLSTFP